MKVGIFVFQLDHCATSHQEQCAGSQCQNLTGENSSGGDELAQFSFWMIKEQLLVYYSNGRSIKNALTNEEHIIIFGVIFQRKYLIGATNSCHKISQGGK